jgi:hypothetical protein
VCACGGLPQPRSSSEKAFFGWPESAPVEAEVAAWFEAKNLEEEKAIARRLNKAAFDHVVYAPLGVYLQQQAWRTSVAGVQQAICGLWTIYVFVFEGAPFYRIIRSSTNYPSPVVALPYLP